MISNHMVQDCECPDGICTLHWSREMARRKAALRESLRKPKVEKSEPKANFEKKPKRKVEIEDDEF